jgi:hypothetical protein
MTRKGARLNWKSMAHNRETTWARSTNVFSLAGAGSFQTVDLLAPFKAMGGVQQGVTVTRTHLNISVTNVINSGDTFSWGLIRGQNTDVGGVIAGAPVPDLDPYEDWLWWSFEQAASSSSGAVTGAHFFPGGSNNQRIDVRAQRKLPDLQMTYNLVVKRQTVVAASLNLQITASVLLKLP